LFVPGDEGAQMAAGQLLAHLVRCRQFGLAVDMSDRDRVAGGEGFFQRFVELPFLASPRRDGGFIVHGESVAETGAGGECGGMRGIAPRAGFRHWLQFDLGL